MIDTVADIVQLLEMGVNVKSPITLDWDEAQVLLRERAMMRLVLTQARQYIKAHWHNQYPGVLIADMERLIGERE